jgi:hypothetical protein
MILFETLFALIYGFMWEQRLPTLLELLAFILVVLSVLTCIAAHANGPQRAVRGGAAAASGNVGTRRPPTHRRRDSLLLIIGRSREFAPFLRDRSAPDGPYRPATMLNFGNLLNGRARTLEVLLLSFVGVPSWTMP